MHIPTWAIYVVFVVVSIAIPAVVFHVGTKDSGDGMFSGLGAFIAALVAVITVLVCWLAFFVVREAVL